MDFHASLKRFAALILHRRAGKTTAVLNHHLRAALDDEWERRRLLSLRHDLSEGELKELLSPPGGRHYGHILPTLKQAKSVAWDKLKHYAEVIPGVTFNESELLVRLPNGNKVQLFGADNPDSFRGMAFSGLSFDEYSQMAENIFSEVLSKALADHLGYAIWLGTIKGKDHLFRTWEAFKNAANNYALWQDIDRSLATEDGITIKLLETAMADDRQLVGQGLMSQDEFDQEWYLSTEAAIQGAWYRKEMYAAFKEGRITAVPWEPALPVDTDWDIGMVDAAVIIFSQTTRAGQIRIIDYEEAEGEPLPYFIRKMRERPYTYGKHYPPHDSTVKDFGTGKSTFDVARDLGLKFEYPVEAPSVLAGIDAARLMLLKVWFDEKKCARLIECLRQYRKTYNARLETFTGVPVHNWASHGADALRGMAVRHKNPVEARRPAPAPSMPRTFAWA